MSAARSRAKTTPTQATNPASTISLTGSPRGDALLAHSLTAMIASCTSTAGIFDDESARSFVRAVRAMVSEVKEPTKPVKRGPEARPASGGSDPGPDVDSWVDEDDLRV